MKTMFSNIMLGKIFNYFYKSNILLVRKIDLRYFCYEHTRYRKKPKFGTRFLKDSLKVYEFNSWDNVEWNEEQENEAKMIVEKNSKILFTEDELNKYEEDADKYWNSFYNVHENRFFKDRHWLFTEFPELILPESELEQNNQDKNMELNSNDDNNLKEEKQRKIFEIGCGVGNTIIPILKYSQDEKNLKVYGCDFSSKAIDILRENRDFDKDRCEVFVMDATKTNWNVPFNENCLDIIVLIFVLSAIHPDKMKILLKNCYKYLKPGGVVLLRDYGRYDMAQLRFKTGKCLQDNFYVRGDGTRAYFFTQNELKELFEECGFVEEQNLVDRRLQVNRGRMLKMYRVWIQTKYCKPI